MYGSRSMKSRRVLTHSPAHTPPSHKERDEWVMLSQLFSALKKPMNSTFFFLLDIPLYHSCWILYITILLIVLCMLLLSINLNPVCRVFVSWFFGFGSVFIWDVLSMMLPCSTAGSGNWCPQGGGRERELYMFCHTSYRIEHTNNTIG